MRIWDEQYTRTPFSGIRRMTVWLRQQDYTVHPKRVARLLRTMGLETIAPKPRTSQADPAHRIYPYLLRGVPIRRVNHVWSTELRGIVQAGLVDQQGASGWTSYMLRISREPVAQDTRPTDEEEILAYVRRHGSINNAERRKLLGVDDKRAWCLLNKLYNFGRIQQFGEGCWSRYALP